MRLCAITDRRQLAEPGEPEAALRGRLRRMVTGWIAGGVDWIQLREKDLDPLALAALAEEIFAGQLRPRTRLLINSSAGAPAVPDVLRALASIAHGIHLPGPPQPDAARLVRQAFLAAGHRPIVSMSCHSLEDVKAAQSAHADFVLFAPVFGKRGIRDLVPGQGLQALSLACQAAGEMPVFALGGITAANASGCVAAGAAGVAGIRLFAGDGWRKLRAEPQCSEHPEADI